MSPAPMALWSCRDARDPPRVPGSAGALASCVRCRVGRLGRDLSRVGFWTQTRLQRGSSTERTHSVAHRDDQALFSLPILAVLIGVHVRTLRNAARDGRLAVSYDTRTTFRRLRARATLADARAFRQSYYGKRVRDRDRRAPLDWSTIPPDYDVRIRALRQTLGMSQARFAQLVGAARKAVVYQWESREADSFACVLAQDRTLETLRATSCLPLSKTAVALPSAAWVAKIEQSLAA